MKVSIQVNGLNLELAIVALRQVRPHEATVPRILDSIIADLERSNYQRDPILIDGKTRTALDGMHRRAALKAIGAKFALCAEYDYLSDSINLERWLRYFIAPNDEFLAEVISTLKLRKCEDFHEAVRAVDKGRIRIALISAGMSYTSDQRKWDIFQVYEAVGKIDKLCQKYRIELEFTDDSSKFELFTSESVYLLYPLKILKKHVLQIAKKGKVFPCKTTRHIVPIRPMGVYFPLELLRGSSESDCVEELKNIVKSSKIQIEEREVWYEGRRYSEPLAIFRREK